MVTYSGQTFYLTIYSLILIIAVVVKCLIETCKTPPSLPPQQDIEIGHISQINTTSVHTKTIIKFEDLEEKDGTCSICLEEFGISHEFMCINKCRHVFHRFCIDSWLEKNRTCPICRCSVDWSQIEKETRARCFAGVYGMCNGFIRLYVFSPLFVYMEYCIFRISVIFETLRVKSKLG